MIGENSCSITQQNAIHALFIISGEMLALERNAKLEKRARLLPMSNAACRFGRLHGRRMGDYDIIILEYIRVSQRMGRGAKTVNSQRAHHNETACSCIVGTVFKLCLFTESNGSHSVIAHCPVA